MICLCDVSDRPPTGVPPSLETSSLSLPPSPPVMAECMCYSGGVGLLGYSMHRVQCCSLPGGKGDLILTGSVSQATRESVLVALHWYSHWRDDILESLGLASGSEDSDSAGFALTSVYGGEDKRDLHIHFSPTGGTRRVYVVVPSRWH